MKVVWKPNLQLMESCSRSSLSRDVKRDDVCVTDGNGATCCVFQFLGASQIIERYRLRAADRRSVGSENPQAVTPSTWRLEASMSQQWTPLGRDVCRRVGRLLDTWTKSLDRQTLMDSRIYREVQKRSADSQRGSFSAPLPGCNFASSLLFSSGNFHHLLP